MTPSDPLTPPDKAEVASDLARDVISHMAPQELPVFRRVSETFSKDPERALKPGKPKDDMLGFGLEGAVSLITPVVLTIAYDVVTFLLETLSQAVKDEGADAIRTAVKQIIKPSRSEPADESMGAANGLTPEELTLVRTRVLEKLSQLEMAQTQAALIADSVVGSLVVKTPIDS